MAKKYIFITMTISGMGGAEQYLNNKVKYLKNKGYEVFVLSGLLREILIEALREYENFVLPALMYSPFFFSDSEVEKTLAKAIDFIQFGEEDVCLIESTSIAASEWAEMLAKTLSCKHVIFNLQESHNYSSEEKDFLRFKLDHKELSGITKDSVRMMIPNYSFEYEPWMHIKAYCSNVVDDCEDKYSSLLWPDADITFGSIGRLEKSCVSPIIDQIIRYADLNKSKKINVLMIGGSKERRVINRIKDRLSSHDNCNLVITGLIYPIPRSLVNNTDIFISTAGSAAVSYYENKPTIKVHPFSGKPIGILGYSYVFGKASMYDVCENQSILDMIEQILEGDIKIEYQSDYNKSYLDQMEQEFNRQIEIASWENGTYYDTRNLKPIRNMNSIAYLLIGKAFGSSKMQMILESCRRILK